MSSVQTRSMIPLAGWLAPVILLMGQAGWGAEQPAPVSGRHMFDFTAPVDRAFLRLASESPEERCFGAELLGPLGGLALEDAATTRIVDLLTQALSDSHPEVRRAAITALNRMTKAVLQAGPGVLRQAVEGALGVLHDNDAEVRSAAAAAINSLLSPSASGQLLTTCAKALATSLQGEKDAGVIRDLARTLGTLALRVSDKSVLKPAVPPLLRALQTGDVRLRLAALQALGSVALLDRPEEARQLVPPALKALTDKDDDVRVEASVWLWMILLHVTDAVTLRLAVAPLQKALEDRVSDVRANAVMALLTAAPRLRDNSLLADLSRRLEQGEITIPGWQGITVGMVGAIASNRNPTALSPRQLDMLVTQALNDLRATKEDAGETLFEGMGVAAFLRATESSPEALSRLVEAVRKEDASARRALVSGLVLALNGANEQSRDACAVALAAMLTDADPDVRSPALRGLDTAVAAGVGPEAAKAILSPLQKCLADDDPTISYLGGMGLLLLGRRTVGEKTWTKALSSAMEALNSAQLERQIRGAYAVVLAARREKDKTVFAPALSRLQTLVRKEKPSDPIHASLAVAAADLGLMLGRSETVCQAVAALAPAAPSEKAPPPDLDPQRRRFLRATMLGDTSCGAIIDALRETRADRDPAVRKAASAALQQIGSPEARTAWVLYAGTMSPPARDDNPRAR